MCYEPQERGFSKAYCLRTLCQIFIQFYSENLLDAQFVLDVNTDGNVKRKIKYTARDSKPHIQ